MANLYSKEINHIGVSVPDLDKALDWYQKIFGFEIIWKTETIRADDSSQLALLFKDIFGPHFKKAKVAMLGSDNNVGFEIFEFIDPKAERRTDNFEYWKSGFFHICITDSNIEELSEKICNNGGRLRSEFWKPVQDKERKLVYCEDPFGNIIEISTHSLEPTIGNQ